MLLLKTNLPIISSLGKNLPVHLSGGVSEKVNNPHYSTSVGLINYGRQNWSKLEYDNSININSIFKQTLSKIGNLLKNWY